MNQVTLYLASDFIFYEKIKHIEMNCHFTKKKSKYEDITTRFNSL